MVATLISFILFLMLGAALVCLLSIDYIKKYGTHYGEYYILVQSSVLGMMLMAGAKDLLVIFLGLELMSVSFYVLAGIKQKKKRSKRSLYEVLFTWRVRNRFYCLRNRSYLRFGGNNKYSSYYTKF